MKRKLFNVLLILSLMMSLTVTGIFAESKPAKIQSISQLKAALNQNLTESEEKAVIEETESGVMDAFMTEKMDEAVELLNSQERDLVMKQLPDGAAYAARSYDLGDGCTLTVELSDREEGQALKVPQISPMATSGSSDQWNHYTLSADGIEERSGVADVSWSVVTGTCSKSKPVITDRTAKTVGASDVNMHCNYTFKGKDGRTEVPSEYKLNTTVGYVAINKTAKQIKVRQSWNLTKIS